MFVRRLPNTSSRHLPRSSSIRLHQVECLLGQYMLGMRGYRGFCIIEILQLQTKLETWIVSCIKFMIKRSMGSKGLGNCYRMEKVHCSNTPSGTGICDP